MSTTPHASATGPNQSPHATINVVARGAASTVSTIAARPCTGAVARSAPLGAITAEMPVLVARTCGRRVSMLRKADTMRMSRGTSPYVNQESLESVTIRSAPPRIAARAKLGTAAS